MKDPSYYRNLINQILTEHSQDEIPELPSDAELDQLKTQTLVNIGKMP